MLPAALKNRLEKKEWYLKFRYSPLVLKAWLRLRRGVANELKEQKKLYASALNSSSAKLIFDIGAHEGFVTQMFADMGYAVIAVEPSRRNAAILQARFRRNKRVHVLRKAVSDKEGEQLFFE